MRTILIVEDIELNIDLLVQLLEADYRLIIARDGAEGVALALQEKPDLVLMDISLPVMDGYEATQKIRSAFPLLPVVALSAHAMQGDVEKARAAGCNDYLLKPLDEDLLFRKLREMLG